VGESEDVMTIHFSPVLLNIVDGQGRLLCPCCGFADQFSRPPYDKRGGIIGSGICGACLWEPGFDDDPMASAVAQPTILGSLLAYRAEWIAAGSLWRGSTRLAQPKDWHAQATLNVLREYAAHLMVPHT
jgi:hypothetical protein